MKKIILKALIVTTALAGSYSANAASCYYVDPQFTASAKQAFTAANQRIIQKLVGMDVAVSKASKEESDAITSAIFVLSNQKAVATEQINTALKTNSQTQAAAMQSISQAKRYQQVLRDYGVQGLGHNICEVQVKREDIQETTQATQEAIGAMVKNEITARAGRYANRREAMATRLALHDKYYCTEGQAKAGLCSGAGSRAAKSLSASTMFQPADYLSAEYNDKSALINNMVGLPDDPVPANQATTLAGQSYSDLKRRKDAIKSTAMTSLKSIQADWSTVPNYENKSTTTESAKAKVETEKQQLAKNAPATPTGEKSGEEKRALSLMAQVQQDVSRYLGGGKEYQEWSKTLTGQEEKGVLTEVLKVKALRLYIQTQEFKQLQRMEAMLAANVAAETENNGMSGRIEAQRQVAVRQSIRDNMVN